MQELKISIKKWAKDDRPREKLLGKNPSTLSDSELLAILIGNGNREKNAIELAKDVLRLGKNNLNELGKVTIQEMMRLKGIGKVKAITIIAALELGRRRQAALSLDKPIVKSSRDIANYMQALFRDLPHEVFAVAYLNQANRINHLEIISKGGITGTVADPRVILKKAILEDAVNLIICHNHPSGSLQPSRADQDLTKKLKEAAKLFDISLFDHIIVSENGYFSFADAGML
jgi:DNA repair protein RadC